MIEKKVIVNSFMWNAVETYTSQGIMLLISIVMARILSPSDYGIIGIIAVFLALSETLIDSGFANALLRRQNCTNTDYSTVFYFNIFISLMLFVLLYITSPYIASFYNLPILTSATRLMGLTFVISSFSTIHKTKLTKELNFKAQAFVSIVCAIISGVSGIYMAYNGLGVWALIYQAVLSAILKMVITIIYVRWYPTLSFSKVAFKEMFGFGSKILISNILFTVHNNIYNIVIGKVFPPASLGYFSRADGYSKIIPTNISGVLLRILFPVLTKIQNNDNALCAFNCKIVDITSFFIFPACLFLAGFAHPVIVLMLSDKWAGTVPILQILCISVIFDPLVSINTNFILIKGASGALLKQKFYTQPISLIILAVSVFFGLIGLAIGKVIYSIINMLISYHYMKQVLPVSTSTIFTSIGKIFLVSMILGVASFFVFEFISIKWEWLLLGLVFNVTVYLVCARAFFPETLKAVLYIRKIK